MQMVFPLLNAFFIHANKLFGFQHSKVAPGNLEYEIQLGKLLVRCRRRRLKLTLLPNRDGVRNQTKTAKRQPSNIIIARIPTLFEVIGWQIMIDPGHARKRAIRVVIAGVPNTVVSAAQILESVPNS